MPLAPSSHHVSRWAYTLDDLEQLVADARAAGAAGDAPVTQYQPLGELFVACPFVPPTAPDLEVTPDGRSKWDGTYHVGHYDLDKPMLRLEGRLPHGGDSLGIDCQHTYLNEGAVVLVKIGNGPAKRVRLIPGGLATVDLGDASARDAVHILPASDQRDGYVKIRNVTVHANGRAEPATTVLLEAHEALMVELDQ